MDLHFTASDSGRNTKLVKRTKQNIPSDQTICNKEGKLRASNIGDPILMYSRNAEAAQASKQNN